MDSAASDLGTCFVAPGTAASKDRTEEGASKVGGSFLSKEIVTTEFSSLYNQCTPTRSPIFLSLSLGTYLGIPFIRLLARSIQYCRHNLGTTNTHAGDAEHFQVSLVLVYHNFSFSSLRSLTMPS